MKSGTIRFCPDAIRKAAMIHGIVPEARKLRSIHRRAMRAMGSVSLANYYAALDVVFTYEYAGVK